MMLPVLALATLASAGPVELTVTDHAGVYQVRGSFAVSASADTAWSVLTDYARIPEFVKSMKSSTVEQAEDGGLRVKQQAVQRFMLVKKTINVTLAISEQPGRRIEFRDVLGKDFRHFEGSWEIERREGGLVVTYALDAKPMSQPPGFVGRMLMSGSARDQLEQVRAEILRRERHEEDNVDNN